MSFYPPFDEYLRDFQLEIGRFVMNFCSLEWVAFEALARLDPERFTTERLEKLEIQRRVVTLLEVSRERVNGPDREEWLRLWELVCSLVGDRKKILHNPIMIDIMTNAEGDVRLDPARLHLIRQRSEQRERLTIEYVRRCADKAQDYAATSLRLWHAVIRQPIFV